MLNIPRMMICATSSGSGKTWITSGLLRTFQKRGIRVEAFKCGPDYIDPMFHSKVLRIPCRNLDPYFVEADTLTFLFQQGNGNRQLSVVEGVMGFYDGIGGVSEEASSYELASILQIPVFLVVSCRGMGGSAAAVVQGYVTYRNPSYIQGIILNHISETRYPKLKEKIEKETGVEVVGYVPERKDLALQSRHLGLVMPEECEAFQRTFDELSEVLEKTLDINRMLQIASSAKQMEAAKNPFNNVFAHSFHVQVGIARDEAFCFLYEDNLNFLKALGAKLVFFSPLWDQELPKNLDGIIFPGGYPEVYAKQLRENDSMLRSVRAVAPCIPVLAECGGFLYLHEILEDAKGEPYPMAGVIKGKAYPTKKLTRFGYIELEANKDQLLLKKGERIRAHEFHYWESEYCGNACLAKKASSEQSWDCVYGNDYLYAGFPHIYFYANPASGVRFLKTCMERKGGR